MEIISTKLVKKLEHLQLPKSTTVKVILMPLHCNIYDSIIVSKDGTENTTLWHQIIWDKQILNNSELQNSINALFNSTFSNSYNKESIYDSDFITGLSNFIISLSLHEQIVITELKCISDTIIHSNYSNNVSKLDVIVQVLLNIISQKKSSSEALPLAVSALSFLLESHENFESILTDSNMLQLFRLSFNKSVYPQARDILYQHVESCLCRLGLRRYLQIKRIDNNPCIQTELIDFLMKWINRLKASVHSLSVETEIACTINNLNNAQQQLIPRSTLLFALEVMNDITESSSITGFTLMSKLLELSIDLSFLFNYFKSSDMKISVNSIRFVISLISNFLKKSTSEERLLNAFKIYQCLMPNQDSIDTMLSYIAHVMNKHCGCRNDSDMNRLPLSDISNKLPDKSNSFNKLVNYVSVSEHCNDTIQEPAFVWIVSLLFHALITCINYQRTKDFKGNFIISIDFLMQYNYLVETLRILLGMHSTYQSAEMNFKYDIEVSICISLLLYNIASSYSECRLAECRDLSNGTVNFKDYGDIILNVKMRKCQGCDFSIMIELLSQDDLNSLTSLLNNEQFLISDSDDRTVFSDTTEDTLCNYENRASSLQEVIQAGTEFVVPQSELCSKFDQDLDGHSEKSEANFENSCGIISVAESNGNVHENMIQLIKENHMLKSELAVLKSQVYCNAELISHITEVKSELLSQINRQHLESVELRIKFEKQNELNEIQSKLLEQTFFHLSASTKAKDIIENNLKTIVELKKNLENKFDDLSNEYHKLINKTLNTENEMKYYKNLCLQQEQEILDLKLLMLERNNTITAHESTIKQLQFQVSINVSKVQNYMSELDLKCDLINQLELQVSSQLESLRIASSKETEFELKLSNTNNQYLNACEENKKLQDVITYINKLSKI